LIFSFLFLCCQFIFGPSFSFAKSENINVAGGASVRYPSFFQDPQKYAQFLAALSFLMIIQRKDSDNSSNTFGYLIAILSILALMLTGGRAGLGGWLIGLVVFLLFANAMYRIQLLFSVLLIGAVIFIYQDQIPIFKRAGLEESYLFRQSIWQDALLIHQDNPIVGIGIGNYANYVSIHNPDQFWINGNEITYYDHPESGYLKILVEQGKFGFLLLFLMILVPVYHSFVTFAISKNANHILFIAALISWLIGFYTVYSLGDVRIRILVASILVLLVSESFKTKNQYKIEDPR
jgi:O-antigen ligase